MTQKVQCSRKNFDRYGRHKFSPNEDDLSYSVQTIIPDNIKLHLAAIIPSQLNNYFLPSSLPTRLAT